MPSPSVLSLVALNRATLARQLLLTRERRDVVEATGRLGGLQAQEPASPYIALWTRLEAFDPADLDRAFAERHLVKATLLRSTLHAVPAADYRAIRPAVAPMLAGMARRERGGRLPDDRLERLRAAAVAHAAVPRTNTELRDHVAAIAEADGGPAGPAANAATDDLWWWVKRHAALVHAPSGPPWSFGRRPLLVAADAWLPGTAFAPESAALEHVARRYLGAFGPATPADIGAWSGLGVGRLRPAIAALDARGELRHFADNRGRALLDLTDAPRPDPATPAPPRLLPMWDSLLLAHADRTRVISDADRARVIATNGDTYPTFLVDGRVAGLWWTAPDPQGRARIELEPFRLLERQDRLALEAEGERLAAFLEARESGAYGRYRASRDRRRRAGSA